MNDRPCETLLGRRCPEPDLVNSDLGQPCWLESVKKTSLTFSCPGVGLEVCALKSKPLGLVAANR